MKKGFTLIELLAVIVILSIILLIAVPIVLRVIGDFKKESSKDSVELYGRSIETAVSNYYMKNPEKEKVTLQLLKDEGYLQYKGTEPVCSETIIRNKKVYLAGCKVGKTKVDVTYGEYIPQPDIADTGLTPVVYRNNNWVVVDSLDDEWYDYDDQVWANAVVLRSDVTKEVGDKVTVEGTNPEALMMLVWIPRYEYKYTDLGDQYAGGTQELPGGIEIKFISKSTTKESSSEYKIHPAFNFDGAKNGFWVGKFELSSKSDNTTSSNNLGCNATSCTSDISKLRILPNVPSLRYNDVSNFFYAIRSIENTQSFGLNNIDTHMMKNSEWGAVAYLSQSKYGKYGNSDYDKQYKEVYQNKSSYITGSSNGTPSQSDYRSGGQCAYNDMQDLGEDPNGYKKGQCGPGASTTGNIYGVYDMSGGSWEYVMGAYGPEHPTLQSSGFTSVDVFSNEIINPKYYDLYKTGTANTACNNEVCYGHALSETSGWYGNGSNMVDLLYPWFVRGGKVSSPPTTGEEGIKDGIFRFNGYGGNSTLNKTSTRFVGIAK